MKAAWEEILTFWFGELDADGLAAGEKKKRWWIKDPGFDEELRQRFGELHAALLAGEHSDWLDNPRGALAAVIVLDQFSRNMFRGTAEMFAADPVAREIVNAALAKGFDSELPPAMLGFLYMPLMHSEDLADQDRCVALFAARAAETEGAVKESFAGSESFARKHLDIVARFDRFPHRNETLDRESTAEEREFLSGPGSSF